MGAVGAIWVSFPKAQRASFEGPFKYKAVRACGKGRVSARPGMGG